jgi:putative ABC transport system permease protein
LRAFQEVSFSDDELLFADASFLTMFSFPLLKGDARTALEEINTAVVTETTARKYFGDEEPIGKRIIVNGQDNYVITGVLKDIPENSHVRFDFLFSMRNVLTREGYQNPWDWENFNVYLQLKPSTSAAALEAKLPAFIEEHRGAELRKSNRKVAFGLLPLQDIHMKPGSSEAKQVYFLLLIAGFILVIAWVNYINLSTARATERAREVGIRKVVGAHRTQLIRQFLLESCLLNAIAAGVALLLVVVSLPAFSNLIGRKFTMGILAEYPAVLVAFGVAFLAGTLLAGLYPAFVLSMFRPVTVLKGKLSHSPQGVSLRKGLVVFQFAASVTLIVGTLGVYSQLEYMRNQDLGFKAEQMLVVEAPRIRGTGYSRKWDSFKNRLVNYASINHIATSSSIPGKWYSWGTSGIRRKDDRPENAIKGALFWADYDFIPAYGIKLVAGRNFSPDYPTDKEGIILNEKAAGLLGFTHPEEALQQQIIFSDDTLRVLGVVQNYHHNSLKSDHDAGFIALDETAGGGYYSVMVNGQNIRSTVAMIEREYKQTFPGNPFSFYFLDQLYDDQYKSDRQFGQVFSLFASLAILVACLGLFGLASFTAVQRTQEIGIRKVMGASVDQIVRLLYRDFVKLVIVAILVAWPLAYLAMNKWLEGYPFKVGIQWWMFAVPSLAVLLVALLTVSFQALKAALANPANSLRSE